MADGRSRLISPRGYTTIDVVPFGRRCLGAILILLLMGLGAPARADGDESAEMRARTHFASARYQEALDIYARLYAETLHPTYLRNIARCYQGLKDPDKAISSFQEYLRKAKELSPEQRAEIDGHIAEMEQLKRSRATAAVPPPPPPAPPPPAATSSPALLDSPAVVTKQASDAEPGPIYTRWWFWASVAAVAAVGITSAVLLSADGDPRTGSLGELDVSDKSP